MSTAAQQVWPSAKLDAVARLRALAAARPHVAYLERTLDAPFEVVWSVFGDLENGVPQFDRYVRRIRITGRDGERLALESNGPLGIPMRFEAIHRPGWYERFHAELRRPEGNLLLTGSDLANGWAGFIDGAIGGGARAARRVVERLRAVQTPLGR